MPCVGRINTYSSPRHSGVKGFFVASDPLLLLAVFYLSNLAAMLLLSLSLSFTIPPSHYLFIFFPPFLPPLTSYSTSPLPFSSISLSFFPFTGKLWNSLPASVFPPVYELSAFKRGAGSTKISSAASISCVAASRSASAMTTSMSSASPTWSPSIKGCACR